METLAKVFDSKEMKNQSKRRKYNFKNHENSLTKIVTQKIRETLQEMDQLNFGFKMGYIKIKGRIQKHA